MIAFKFRTLIDQEFVPVYLNQDGFYHGDHIYVRKKDVDIWFGLWDEDGQEVWENDIIDYIWMDEVDKEGVVDKALVGFVGRKFCFMLLRVEKWPLNIDPDLKISGFRRRRIRVVGNYRKNPELIGGK